MCSYLLSVYSEYTAAANPRPDWVEPQLVASAASEVPQAANWTIHENISTPRKINERHENLIKTNLCELLCIVLRRVQRYCGRLG